MECPLRTNGGHQGLPYKRKTASRRSSASPSGRNGRGGLSRAMLLDVARANLVGIRREVHIEHVRIFADGSVCCIAEIFSGIPAENWQEASADDMPGRTRKTSRNSVVLTRLTLARPVVGGLPPVKTNMSAQLLECPLI